MRLTPVLLAGALTLAGCGKSEPPAEAPATGETGVEAPAPAVAPTAAMVACAASFRLSPFHATRSQTCRAALSRMKYSPDPVAETAHRPLLA